MTTANDTASAGDEPRPIVTSPNPDTVEVKKPKTTKRTDAALTFVRNWLSNHGVAVTAFGDEDAIALVEAVDASK